MQTEQRYFYAGADVRLANGDLVRKAVFSRHSDSFSDQDTLDSIPQIVGDLMQDVQFDAPVERVEIATKRLIAEKDYWGAPKHQRY